MEMQEQGGKEEMATDITSIIRERRLELGLSQRQLGEMVGCDQATIGNYEKSVPGSVENVLRIMKALDMKLVVRKKERKE